MKPLGVKQRRINMSLFKLIKHTLILTVFAGFYGCVGTAVEIMREQMEQQLDELRLQEEEESKVVEPEVVKAVDDSAKWEQNKLESAKRYAIWDNWRNQNYEYQNDVYDRELKIRLSFLFRSDYYVGEGAMGTADQASEFEIMIQNKTDSEFNLFLNNQDFKFLIDGKERTYGSAPAEGIEKLLLPHGSYDKTGKHREDLVILKFRHSQPLSEASIDRIFGSGEDILEEDIIPIRVDANEYNQRFVTVLLNGKKYYLIARHGWNGLPFSEDKALHDKIKLSPEAPSISNNPNWRGQGMYNGDSSIITLADLRRVALSEGINPFTIGCDIEAKKKAFDDALRLAQEVSNGECEGETSENLFKAYREYGACLVAGKEKNEIMQSMYYLEGACGENL